MSQDLHKLKAKLKNISMAQLAVDLGYRSPQTINAWFKNGEIPERAKPIVKFYLNQKSKESK